MNKVKCNECGKEYFSDGLCLNWNYASGLCCCNNCMEDNKENQEYYNNEEIQQ